MTTTMEPPTTLSLVEVLRARRQRKNEPPLPDRRERKAIRDAVDASLHVVASRCGVSTFAVRSWERLDGGSEPQGANRVAYKLALDEMRAYAQELAEQTQK